MLDFTSIGYLAFLLVGAAAFHFCPVRFRPPYLLVISYVFYLTYNPGASLLLAAATVFAWGAGLILERRRGRGASVVLVAAIAILVLISIIAFYKIAAVVSGIAAPLGISYYTFKLISYVVEIYWERIPAEGDLIVFGAYVSFFPQLVAGPIQRPGDFLRQNPPLTQDFRDGVLRIATGLFKKLVVADGLGLAVSAVYASAAANLSRPNVWLAFCAFPMQLYADFSGLTDIAIGSGLLFGIRGPENFNRPFSATSISDYWRRWHMSLTTWLTDYVFTPLRMATRSLGQLGLVVSITVNMVLIGLWHGLSWTYVIFGLLNSAYMIVDALSSQARRKFFKRRPSWNEAANWAGWLLTLSLVAVAAVFFRARSVASAFSVLQRLGGDLGTLPSDSAEFFQAPGNNPFVVGLAGYLLMDLGDRFKLASRIVQTVQAMPRWIRLASYSAATVVLAIGLMLLAARASGPRSPFLYEQF